MFVTLWSRHCFVSLSICSRKSITYELIQTIGFCEA